MKPWHEDDSFWETMGPAIFSKEHWANAPKEVQNLISLLELSPKAYILDLCCGPGRHSLELTRKGFKVMGVDRTLKYINDARKRAERESLNVKFIQDDMRTFYRADTFNVVINLYTSFGYFKNQDEDKQVLKNIHVSLKPTGKLMIDRYNRKGSSKTYLSRKRLA